jgi:pre-mRNA-processing factor 40
MDYIPKSPLKDESQELVYQIPKEEAYYKFKEKLKLLGITATWKWEDASRLLFNEPEWKIIRTFSEKRSLFNEYINDLKSKEKEEIYLKREKNKSKFRQLLSEDNTINSDSTYTEAMSRLSYDERWRSVDEKEREDVFEDYIDLIYKKEEDEWKKSRDVKKKLFLDKLKFKNIKSDTLWKTIKYDFKDDPVFVSMEKIDRIQTFAEYITNLECKEKNEKREKEKYQGYQNREKFRELLQISVEEKTLNMETKWRDYVQKIKDKDEYLNMLGQEGSTPLELFQDKIQELKNKYKKIKKIFKEIIVNNKIEFKFKLTFEEFDNLISKYEQSKLISKDMKELLYEHIKKKLNEKEIIHNKHSKTIANKLYSYLQRKKLSLPDDCPIEEAYPKIKKLKKFENLSESNIKEGYILLKQLLKEKPITENNENLNEKNNNDNNNNDDNKINDIKNDTLKKNNEQKEQNKEIKEENISIKNIDNNNNDINMDNKDDNNEKNKEENNNKANKE